MPDRHKPASEGWGHKFVAERAPTVDSESVLVDVFPRDVPRGERQRSSFGLIGDVSHQIPKPHPRSPLAGSRLFVRHAVPSKPDRGSAFKEVLPSAERRRMNVSSGTAICPGTTSGGGSRGSEAMRSSLSRRAWVRSSGDN